jgi:uncharacterized alpha-E superfamily protein
MLSRVADSLYWMSRYLERAEHTARLLDVNLHQTLEQSSAPANRRLARVQASLRVSVAPERSGDIYTLASALTFDSTNPDSIVAVVAAARENARQVREQISSEMWEQINRLYLNVRRAGSDIEWRTEPQQFYKAVKEGIHLFQGITDATMSHDEGWQFIQIGRFLERASATAALLDAHFAGLEPSAPGASSLSYLGWVALLKSCTSFEEIAEFLLLNADVPRSVRFSADAVHSALQVIARTTRARGAGRVDRLAGRLRATLDYGQVDEIMLDLHAYLDQIQRQCAQIHSAINQAYVSYPADAALST